jgi:hydrogenase/urease accessory protein HupE
MNVGGRIIGVTAAPIAITLSGYMVGNGPSQQQAVASAIVGGVCYAVGILLSFFLPPSRKSED